MNNMLIDVIVLTKNSELHLEKCLKAIYENIPINNLFIIDGHSTDRTIDIVSQFEKKYGNVLIIKDDGNRATSRQKGIKRVKTDWFMFVDSDVILCKDWYKKAKTYMEENVGLIWGIEVWSTIHSKNTLATFLLVTRKIFEIRGGTHDTLIRNQLVKDMIIPENLHVFEDAYIKDWITKKGFLSIPCYIPFCIHYRPKEVWTLKGSLKIIAESVKLGRFSMLTKLSLAYGFYTAYSIYQLLIHKKPPKSS
jgi:glycosyltransferase involved in cell wall biosynthesis